MSELATRVVAACVLAPLVLFVVVFTATPVFAIAFSVFVLIGAWEWARLSGLGHPGLRVAYVAAVAAALVVLSVVDAPAPVGLWLILAGLLFWLAASLWVWQFQRVARGLLTRELWRALAGFVVLIPAWYALTRIHANPETGPYWVLFLLLVVWVADIGAYFAGRRYGRRKLASRVSPGKTVEGLFGALLAVSLLAVTAGFWESFSVLQRGPVMLLCLFTVVVSVLGDLTESLVKRIAGVKDSGAIIPGHGGVLDRIDSITAAAPVFAAGLILTGQIQ